MKARCTDIAFGTEEVKFLDQARSIAPGRERGINLIRLQMPTAQCCCSACGGKERQKYVCPQPVPR